MTPALPLIGTEFAGYRLLAVLGRGGMSTVYRAENARLGNIVAVKVLAPEISLEDPFRTRFLQESRIAAGLNHPNVIPIYDAGPCGDLLYIAMRYVAGADLRRLLDDHGRLSPTHADLILGQVARALDAAHRHGLVHRDVKPANILVERGADDTPDHVYLSDFGITKHAVSSSGVTQTGQFVGTIDYIAPEQIQGKPVDGRADIYSLGCVLYECLTGRVPFEKDVDAAVIWAHVEEAPPPPTAVQPDLPRAIDDVLARALAKDPDQRYWTCSKLVEAARLALEHNGGPTRWRAGDSVFAGFETQPAGAPSPAPGDPSPTPAPPPPAGSPEPVAATPAETPSFLASLDRGWRIAIALVALCALAGVAAAATLRGRGSHAADRAATESRMLRALAAANASTMAKNHIPPSSCSQVDASTVRCAHPTNAIQAATFRTFPSLPALYAAYRQAVVTRSPAHAFRANVGDCTPHRVSGEVSWNHNFRHPKRYSVDELVANQLPTDKAGGRVFCTLSGPAFSIVWTMNQGHMLGTLTGAPHDDAWMWWRDVHHSIDLPDQPSRPPRAPSGSPALDAVRRSTVAIVAEPQGEEHATSQHGEHVHGSGVVWDARRGLVLTSDHVVENAGSIDVTIDAGAVARARVLARAECNDLAVLALERKPAQLTAIRPGDSGRLQAGDRVTAVGYLKPASAAEPTYIATRGAVSAADVSFKLFPNQPDLASTVLHQAPTPPQMTGGPLVNQRGELVGLLTVPPDTSSAPGLQVAISSEYLKERLAQLSAAAGGAPPAWRQEHGCRDQMRALEKGALVSHGAPEEHHHGG